MKVPQTFTITLEQAGYLAQLTTGQRSSWIRAAIDAYRAGPFQIQQERDLYDRIVEMMSTFMEERGIYTEYLKWAPEYRRKTATWSSGSQQSGEDGRQIPGDEVSQSGDE